MKSLDYDLGYITAGLEILEMYLLSDEVFWAMNANPPKGESEYPRLTLDYLLLARTRLKGRQLSPDQKDQVEAAIARLDYYCIKWRVAWEGKARQCYQVRERMWRNFILEYQDNPLDNADRYTYEVRVRAMLELLIPELGRQLGDEKNLLPGLDSFLRKILVPSKFIWESEIQAGFPEHIFWFLYGKLPSNFNNR